MMASTDLNVIIASLQMAFILMDKLPDVYRIQFRREGVYICLYAYSYILHVSCCSTWHVCSRVHCIFVMQLSISDQLCYCSMHCIGPRAGLRSCRIWLTHCLVRWHTRYLNQVLFALHLSHKMQTHCLTEDLASIKMIMHRLLTQTSWS